MTDEDLKQVFTPFSRLSAIPTGGELSTGLGLTITKQLVELHNGTIAVQNNVNAGCEFIISLPVCDVK